MENMIEQPEKEIDSEISVDTENNKKENKLWKFLDISVLLSLFILMSNIFFMRQGGAMFRISVETLRQLNEQRRVFGRGVFEEVLKVKELVLYLDRFRYVLIFVGVILLIAQLLKSRENFKVDEKIEGLICKGYFVSLVIYGGMTFYVAQISDLFLGASSYILFAISIIKVLKLFNVKMAKKLKIPFEIEFFDFYVMLFLLSLGLELFTAEVHYADNLVQTVGFGLVGLGFMFSGNALFWSYVVFVASVIYMFSRFFPTIASEAWSNFIRKIFNVGVVVAFLVASTAFTNAMIESRSVSYYTWTFLIMLLVSAGPFVNFAISVYKFERAESRSNDKA